MTKRLPSAVVVAMSPEDARRFFGWPDAKVEDLGPPSRPEKHKDGARRYRVWPVRSESETGGALMSKKIVRGGWCMSCSTRHRSSSPHDEQLTAEKPRELFYANMTDHELNNLARAAFSGVLRPVEEVGREAVIEELRARDRFTEERLALLEVALRGSARVYAEHVDTRHENKAWAELRSAAIAYVEYLEYLAQGRGVR